MHDLAVRGGRVVMRDGVRPLDIAVSDGRIVEVAPEVAGARDEIDANGQVVLPAIVDVHVHFNEPGRTEWEGAATGSHALAAGGGAVFFDMPLNSTPCTVGPAEFDRKRAALEAASIADFGLWGGLVPGRIGDMAALADRGVVGFKAFMCDSGLPEFPRADDATLFEGMKEATRLGLPVAVHAESEELTKELAKSIDGDAPAAFLGSRPVLAELEAIQRALLFAGETGAPLHLVHVSSGRGVALAFAAKAAGVDVSIETCPHYLFFTKDDLERLGAIAKCAPPLRSDDDRQALWSELLAGHVDIVGSDHSPCTPALKSGPFRRAWGGIAGVQSTLDVMIESGCQQRHLPLEHVADLLASRPASRFRIPAKGAIAVGNDADLALIEIDEPRTLEAGHLRQRHPASPYVGHRFRCRVRRTIRRGETVALDGRIVARSTGQFVRPSNRGETDV
jgi:allantoinase